MAAILPGWHSLEGAAKWHRVFEIAGFGALGQRSCDLLASSFLLKFTTLMEFDKSSRTWER